MRVNARVICIGLVCKKGVGQLYVPTRPARGGYPVSTVSRDGYRIESPGGAAPGGLGSCFGRPECSQAAFGGGGGSTTNV